jgi:hypothetical protein
MTSATSTDTDTRLAVALRRVLAAFWTDPEAFRDQVPTPGARRPGGQPGTRQGQHPWPPRRRWCPVMQIEYQIVGNGTISVETRDRLRRVDRDSRGLHTCWTRDRDLALAARAELGAGAVVFELPPVKGIEQDNFTEADCVADVDGVLTPTATYLARLAAS